MDWKLVLLKQIWPYWVCCGRVPLLHLTTVDRIDRNACCKQRTSWSCHFSCCWWPWVCSKTVLKLLLACHIMPLDSLSLSLSRKYKIALRGSPRFSWGSSLTTEL